MAPIASPGSMVPVSARLVLFDIDGTLIRTGGAGVRAFRRAAALLHGTEVGETAGNLRFHGRTDGSLVSELLRSHGRPDTSAERERFLETYAFLLDEELHRHHGDTCPGAAELVSALAEHPDHPVIGLLTGNIRLGAALKLAAHGLGREFVVGAFGDDHLDRNELAKIALRRGSEHVGCRLSGDDVVVIGDTRADIECARAIDAPCIAVATGAESLSEL
ncbi:MAG: haloacid dehalogenase-like hydrolase, partial [Desulfobacterales bacterium]|nr:haloacid dehalogenase-like hydrolase [Desulfobacterales bacterium]